MNDLNLPMNDLSMNEMNEDRLALNMNDDDNASKMFLKSLEMDPNFTLAQKNLDSLK